MSANLRKHLGLGALLLVSGFDLARAEDSAALIERADIPRPAVIAHRGASYDAPESTRAAYLLARELGADYLEMDLQRTRDGVLVVLHDDTLERTTDVARKFPERKDKPVSDFTLAELKTLNAGRWFNVAHPDRARPAFDQLHLLTLDQVIDIAEGNPAHRPGLYIETKAPKQFPGIERDLKHVLKARGWLQGPHKVMLQAFDSDSLALLNKAMPSVPKGPLGPVDAVDDPVDFQKAMDAGVGGIFTNRTAELLKFYGRPAQSSVEQILGWQGY